MSLAEKTPRAQYVSTGGTTYSAPWPLWEDTDVLVYAGEVLQAVDSDYSVTYTAGAEAGGTVIFVAAPDAGVVVTLVRSVPQERTTNFALSGAFSMVALNAQLDKLTAQVQDLQEGLSRALVRPPASTVLGALPLPVAGKAIGYDALGALAHYDTTGLAPDLTGYTQTLSVADVITRNGPVVDIRAYLPAGYVSDGSVDYTTQARAALAAMGPGTLLIPANFTLGVAYPVDGHCILNLSSNQYVRGEGPSSVIRNLNELVDFSRLVGIIDTHGATFENVGVSNLRLDVGRSATTTYTGALEHSAGIFFYATGLIKNILIDRVWIHDSTGDLISLGNGVDGAVVSNVVGWNFLRQGMALAGSAPAAKNITVQGWVEGASTVPAGGSSFHSEPTGGAVLENVTVTGGLWRQSFLFSAIDGFTATGNRIQGVVEGNYAHNIIIHGNEIDASGKGISAVKVGYLEAPTRVSITGNLITGDNGATSDGLYLYRTGAAGAVADADDRVNVSGNTIIGAGQYGVFALNLGNVRLENNDVSSTGIGLYVSNGLLPRVSGNRVDSGAAVALYLVNASTATTYRTPARVESNTLQTSNAWDCQLYGVTALVRDNYDALGAALNYRYLSGGRQGPRYEGRTRAIWLDSGTTLPDWGAWAVGDRVWYGTPVAGAAPGQVCTTAGGQTSATWAATTAYARGDYIKALTGTKVLEVTSTGGGTSGGAEPTWPSTVGGTVVDGTITWTLRATVAAVFKAMASLAA